MHFILLERVSHPGKSESKNFSCDLAELANPIQYIENVHGTYQGIVYIGTAKCLIDIYL